MKSGPRLGSIVSQIVIVGVLFGLCTDPSQAVQGGYWKKYFADQPHKSVEVGEPFILGRQQNQQLILSENEAIQMALANNLEVNVRRYRPLLDFWKIQGLEGVYDHRVSFGFEWDRQTIPSTSVLAGGERITDILTGYSFEFSKDYGSGTTVTARFDGTRNRSTNFFSSLVPAIDTRLEFFIRQDLLRGFPNANSEYQLEIARNDLNIGQEDFRKEIIQIILGVQGTFWEMRFALEDIGVKEKSVELANTILEQNKARLDVGMASGLDVLEAEAEVAVRRESLIRSRYTYLKLRDELALLIVGSSRSPLNSLEIRPGDPILGVNTDSETIDELRRQALELRPEIRLLTLEIQSREVEVQRSRQELRPKLELLLGYQQFGLGGTQIIRDFSEGFIDPPLVGVNPGGLGDAFSQLFSTDFYGYALGFNFEIPLENQRARSENAIAQISLQETRLRQRSHEEEIVREIRDALNDIEMNRARVEAARATQRLELERLEGEKARFEVGIGTTRQLIEAQRELVLSESLEVRAQIDLIKSQRALDKAVGRTLLRSNIRLQDMLEQNVH